MSASWGNAHGCESCLLCSRRIWVGFFQLGVPLVYGWTALARWDWSAVAAEPRGPDSEQHEDKPRPQQRPMIFIGYTESERDKSYSIVCLPRCVLLLASSWGTILKAGWKLSCMYKPEQEHQNGLVYYFLKANQGWALPQKHAFLTTHVLHSHTLSFPYLSSENDPQLRWFKYVCYGRNYGTCSLTEHRLLKYSQERHNWIWFQLIQVFLPYITKKPPTVFPHNMH